jgi:hypothetical protein
MIVTDCEENVSFCRNEATFSRHRSTIIEIDETVLEMNDEAVEIDGTISSHEVGSVSVGCHRPVWAGTASGRRAPWIGIFAAASSISRRSSDVRATSAAPRFSSRRASFVVPESARSRASGRHRHGHRRGRRASYEWQYSVDAGKTWVSAPVALKSKATILGLPVGTVVQFRSRAVTKAGEGDWSQVVSLLVK